MIFHKDIYKEGYKRGWRLGLRSTCPYEDDSDEYESWHLGFDYKNSKVYSSFLMAKFAIPDMDLELYKELMAFAQDDKMPSKDWPITLTDEVSLGKDTEES